jgi:MoaA/NifB/PqqE/SkfB family radical SAM enzyme
VTGGEPFILPYMPRLIADLAAELPVIVLSNGTLFNERRLGELAPVADLPVHVQISLDSPDPDVNDAFRGPDNFRKVVEAVPRLVERGIGVRIATTLEDPEGADPATMERLCELHRALGVPDEDHVVRPIVRRGRARSGRMGVLAGYEQLDPELTITADGAFYSAFGPTVVGGRLDTDLLLTRTVSPLSTPAGALLRVVEDRPAGGDARLGIR